MYCSPSAQARFHTAHNKHVIPSLNVSYGMQHTAHNKHVIPPLTVPYGMQNTAHNKHVIQSLTNRVCAATVQNNFQYKVFYRTRLYGLCYGVLLQFCGV